MNIDKIITANYLLKNFTYRNGSYNAPLYSNFYIKENRDTVCEFFLDIIKNSVNKDDNSDRSGSEWIPTNKIPMSDIFKYVNHMYDMHYIQLSKDYISSKYHYYFDNEISTYSNLIVLYFSNSYKDNQIEISIKCNNISYILLPEQYNIINSFNNLELPTIENDNIYHLFMIPLSSDYKSPVMTFRHKDIHHTYDEQLQTSLKNRLLYQCYNIMDLKHYFIIHDLIEKVINNHDNKVSIHPNMKINEGDIHPTFWSDIHKKEYTCTSHMCYVEDQDLYNITENYIQLHSELIKIFDFSRNYHEYTNLEDIHTIHLLRNGIYILNKTVDVNGIYILTNHTNNTLIVYDSQQSCTPYEFKPYGSIIFNMTEKDMVIVYNPTNFKNILTRYMYI